VWRLIEIAPQMKLAISRQSAAVGAAIGAAAGGFAGFILAALGMREIVGIQSDARIVLFATILGAVVGALNGRWILLAIGGVLFLAFLIIGYTPVMFGVASRWVRDDQLPTTSADAIVVLSAGVKSDGALNAEGVERLLTGLELFQKGLAPRIFTTAVEMDFPDGVRMSTADQKRLVQLGGASSAWTSLTGVFTTRDEALQSATQLPAGAHTVIVVTSPMHTRRACLTFEAVGFKVICKAATEHHFVTWHPIVPTDRLAAFGAYLYERLGMVKYRSQGWIAK
jgi:uncharacterized SAM-binding protein YcdF (DUF218 family)